MVGLLVAAHGRLAEELVATAELIVGKLPGVATCSVAPGVSAEGIREEVRSALRAVDTGEGVLVLADLFGGTPCTQALALSGQHQVEVVTGVNLPMLLKANALRLEPLSLPALAEALVQYGQRNIVCASAMLRDATLGHRPH
ncbi:MAG: PTS sugar transporter subunit IIA [Myxococcales bacterium]|nr:PTS sugar transporter subunit IIA [Myxococcales bacterium]